MSNHWGPGLRLSLHCRECELSMNYTQLEDTSLFKTNICKFQPCVLRLFPLTTVPFQTPTNPYLISTLTSWKLQLQFLVNNSCNLLNLLVFAFVCLPHFVVYYVCLVVQSYLTLCDATDYSPPGSSVHGDSPGKNTGVGCRVLLPPGSSQSKDWIQISCTAGRFFTSWATREAQEYWSG